MTIRGVLIDLDGGAAGAEGLAAAVAALGRGPVTVEVGVTTRTLAGGASVAGATFVLPLDALGIEPTDARILAIAAAGVRCHLRELVVVTDGTSGVHAAVDRTGCRLIVLGEAGLPPTSSEPAAVIPSIDDVADAIEDLRRAEDLAAGTVGVPAHAEPWPVDARLDPELLAAGDRRNVVDRFRYWREEAIIAELDTMRLPVHVAVENWQHDLNIGTVVRNANAFNVAGVHIVGKRRWNRRGAMATDRYLTVTHHPTVDALAEWASGAGLPLVGIDNVAGAVSLEGGPLPTPCVLVFGQEGPGLSVPMQAACSEVREISQHGSTRSLNAGVASGIALHWWAQGRP